MPGSLFSDALPPAALIDRFALRLPPVADFGRDAAHAPRRYFAAEWPDAIRHRRKLNYYRLHYLPLDVALSAPGRRLTHECRLAGSRAAAIATALGATAAAALHSVCWFRWPQPSDIEGYRQQDARCWRDFSRA